MMSYAQNFHRGGRGAGGGRGDRITWAHSRPRLQSSGIEVLSNAFTLTVQKVIAIHQYQLQIEPCRFEFDSETRNPIGLVAGGKFLFSNVEDDGNVNDPLSQPVGDPEEARKRNRSSPLYRRILNQLQEKLQRSRQFFVSFLLFLINTV
jgi:hypothetical protein